jgi:hypothetical protein
LANVSLTPILQQRQSAIVNRNPLPIAAALLAFAAFVLRAVEPNQGRLMNFDKRTNAAASRTITTVAEQNAAADVLKQRISGARIAWDPLILSPRLIFNENGFLTGPDSEEELRPKTIMEAAAVNNETRDPNRRIKEFLDVNAALFGHSSEILSVARLSREYVTAHNGLRTVVWEQYLDGIPVFEAMLYGHIAKNGELVSVSSLFLPGLAAAADAGTPERQRVQETPTISARQAVALAAVNIGETLSEARVESVDAADGAAKRQNHRAEALKGDAETSLIWLPTSRQTMQLCWRVVLNGKTRGQLFMCWWMRKAAKPKCGIVGPLTSIQPAIVFSRVTVPVRFRPDTPHRIPINRR